jgi:hypothetical protein
MDTMRDRQVLEDMVEKGNMPWRLKTGIGSGERAKPPVDAATIQFAQRSADPRDP